MIRKLLPLTGLDSPFARHHYDHHILTYTLLEWYLYLEGKKVNQIEAAIVSQLMGRYRNEVIEMIIWETILNSLNLRKPMDQTKQYPCCNTSFISWEYLQTCEYHS